MRITNILFLFLIHEGTCVLKDECATEIGQLGDSRKEFINCVTHNSVPVTMCIGCVSQFNTTQVKYEALRSNEKCKETIFDKDRINMIVTTQTVLTALWERAYCNNCQINNNSRQFNNILLNFTNCLVGKVPEKVCTECLLHYASVNSFYIDLDNNYNGQVCYDIQDAMNRTRSDWSKKFGCCKRDFKITYFLITATIICSLPIFFYVGIYFYAKQREVNHDILTEDVTAMDSEISALMNNVVINGFAAPNTATTSANNGVERNR